MQPEKYRVFHDLDVRVPKDAREGAIAELHRLRFNVVALTTEYRTPSELTADSCPPQRLRIWTPPGGSKHGTVLVLERAHVVVSDTAGATVLQSPHLARYGMVSAAPASEKLLQQVLQLQQEVDLVTLELAAKRPYHLKRPQVNVAAERGVAFELGYTQLLRAREARRNAVANAAMIVRQTAGRHIVVTSGARKLIEMRGAHDVANLATVFGLAPDAARSALTATPARVLLHADVRLNTTKGIVRVVKTGRADVDPSASVGATDDADEEMNDA